jgi:proline iminopeptidase
MKRKFLFIAVGVLLLVIGMVAGGFWYMSTQPLYKPGMLREMQISLMPPDQRVEGETWLVEPNIELAHFAVGEGRNILVIHGGPGEPFTQPMSGLEPLTLKFRFH